jgi:endonuclease YncB( thermonuclease family)
MHKGILFAFGSVLAAGIVGTTVVLRQHEPAAPMLSAAIPQAAVTAVPANEPAPSEPTPAPPEAAMKPQAADQPAPSPPPMPVSPPSQSLSKLPVQEVEPRAVHAVPESESGVIPHVTLLDRQGHPLARSSASAPPPSYVPSVGPAPNGAASSVPPTSYKPSVPARGVVAQPAQQAALPPVPASLSGAAHATGTVSIAIDGHVVRLYGVLPPASTDRCALGTGAPQSCAEVTQTILAARLARSASVTCQLPPGVGAGDPARICLDAMGADIAGYLVGEGLAVADRHAGGGYASAEGIAQSGGKGLWHFR